MLAFLPAPLSCAQPSLPRRRTRRTCPLVAASQTDAPAAPPAPLAPPAEQVAARLRTELPSIFSRTATPDYSLYAPSVTFEDPLNKFRGVERYAANIAFLNTSPVFSAATMDLHDIAVAPDKTFVRTRWTLTLSANLPWRPVACFTGQSDYVVDPAEPKVVRHIDYWDSLRDSAFLSLPAVADLLSQCRPGRVVPADFGGFELLRRTADFEVRRFANEARQGVSVARVSDSGPVEQWRVVDGEGAKDKACVLPQVAVLALSGPPRSASELKGAERRLRAALDGCAYAEPAERCLYVSAKVRGSVVHEVWIELLQASALVEF